MDIKSTTRVIVITGAANGIGRATSLRFAKDMDKVVLVLMDREDVALKMVAQECRVIGAKTLPIVLDLLNRADLVAAFQRARDECGPVDVLVNNVGQSARERTCDFHESSPDLWEFLIDICLMTTMYCSRQVVNDMRSRRQGKIVNVSSEAAINGGLRCVEYAAAKAGVLGFTRSLARQLAPFNINVNAVVPSIVATRAYDQMPLEVRTKAEGGIPMGRAAKPQEIADAIYYLASDQASFVTGHSLAVAGGNIFN